MVHRSRRYTDSSSSSSASSSEDERSSRRHGRESRSSSSRSRSHRHDRPRAHDRRRGHSDRERSSRRDREREREAASPCSDYSGYSSATSASAGLRYRRTDAPGSPSYGSSTAKKSKVAMILLLGPDEVEFKLTEAQILFDSPNDLTSTYYAGDQNHAKTYKMPDRDASIFQIIFRYMAREPVVPLKRSIIPRHLSFEQTEQKLAEEAKFYRLTRLQQLLPAPLPPTQDPSALYTHPAEHAPAQRGEIVDMTPRRPETNLYSDGSVQGGGNALGLASANGGPILQRGFEPNMHPPSQHSQSAPAPNNDYPPSTIPSGPRGSRPASFVDALAAHPHTSDQPAHALSDAINDPPTSQGHTTGDNANSYTEGEDEDDDEECSNLVAHAFTPGMTSAQRAREPPFPLIDYPDEHPIPHLWVKVLDAEIKFSAFRNARDPTQFELRYSIRILDEPSTRPLAYRISDKTIKAVDSHLRLNGVLSDAECRDVPLRIRTGPGEGETFTAGLDELLIMMSNRGYVKWPRAWQDTFTNITSATSKHQRVCLPHVELLFDLEFPYESSDFRSSIISAHPSSERRASYASFGSGVPADIAHYDSSSNLIDTALDDLASEKETYVGTAGGSDAAVRLDVSEEMEVRNYKVNLWGLKTETRKMRRVKELEMQEAEERRAARRRKMGGGAKHGGQNGNVGSGMPSPSMQHLAYPDRAASRAASRQRTLMPPQTAYPKTSNDYHFPERRPSSDGVPSSDESYSSSSGSGGRDSGGRMAKKGQHGPQPSHLTLAMPPARSASKSPMYAPESHVYASHRGYDMPETPTTARPPPRTAYVSPQNDDTDSASEASRTPRMPLFAAHMQSMSLNRQSGLTTHSGPPISAVAGSGRLQRTSTSSTDRDGEPGRRASATSGRSAGGDSYVTVSSTGTGYRAPPPSEAQQIQREVMQSW